MPIKTMGRQGGAHSNLESAKVNDPSDLIDSDKATPAPAASSTFAHPDKTRLLDSPGSKLVDEEASPDGMTQNPDGPGHAYPKVSIDGKDAVIGNQFNGSKASQELHCLGSYDFTGAGQVRLIQNVRKINVHYHSPTPDTEPKVASSQRVPSRDSAPTRRESRNPVLEHEGVEYSPSCVSECRHRRSANDTREMLCGICHEVTEPGQKLCNDCTLASLRAWKAFHDQSLSR
ncbi:MAG: hypothetical protein Q9159_004986 [Coniocarpon cinnabarinum]